jgi:hypothetical protein
MRSESRSATGMWLLDRGQLAVRELQNERVEAAGGVVVVVRADVMRQVVDQPVVAVLAVEVVAARAAVDDIVA